MSIVKQGWKLIHSETGEDVFEKELVRGRDNEAWVVEGGTPPHKPSSTGRVWVRDLDIPEWNREFFPQVFDMKWVETE